MTTAADGTFQSPVIPGSTYMMTFVPPQGAGYHGVCVLGFIHSRSNGGSWWVVLPSKTGS